MPKEKRKRTMGHDRSVRLSSNRAIQDSAVGHVETARTFKDVQDDLELPTALKKREKQQLKRQVFLERLETPPAPYSRNHARRLKRKAKEQIANGLGEMEAAITAMDIPSPAEARRPGHDESNLEQKQKLKVELRPGQIGEGKSSTLSKGQRKRALELERLRYPLILSNPEFSSHPFQTIRIHAQNTLLRH